MSRRTPVDDILSILENRHLDFEAIPKMSEREASLVALLQSMFPFERWGRIAWQRVDGACCKVWGNWSEMTNAFNELLERARIEFGMSDASVYLIWWGADKPILRIPFESLTICMDDILSADFDIWIICPEKGWCIEKYHEGELCYGVTAQLGVSPLGGQPTDGAR